MEEIKLEYKIQEPPSELKDFVERYYWIRNTTSSKKEIVVIPDGRVDLFFIIEETGNLSGTLIGLETKPTTAFFPPNCTFIGISFKLLAIEYILKTSIADIINTGKELPDHFWDITVEDTADFGHFCAKVSTAVKTKNTLPIDERKQKLFNLIYQTKGSLKVKEYAEKVCWSERQINRYFHLTFGLSLKAVCNLLRFRSSFQHIKDGYLYPEQNYFDQAHFIKEVKKLTKFTPKELSQNENDRFLQFSTIR